MTESHVNLVDVFSSVTQNLIKNQQALNQADELNRDHGNNMVQTFQTITTALQEKKGRSDSASLAYAAKKLNQNATSSSGKLYAQGLAQAATQLKGKQVDSKGAMQLLQSLIGGGQSPQPGGQAGGADMLGSLLGGIGGEAQAQPAGSDMLSMLLGGMAGGDQSQSQADTQSAGGDMLGALLGGVSGSGTSNAGLSDGIDMGDLLQAGLGFLQAKQSGSSTMEALVQAFMGASGMGRSGHRVQSTNLVVSSFLQALGAKGQ